MPKMKKNGWGLMYARTDVIICMKILAYGIVQGLFGGRSEFIRGRSGVVTGRSGVVRGRSEVVRGLFGVVRGLFGGRSGLPVRGSFSCRSAVVRGLFENFSKLIISKHFQNYDLIIEHFSFFFRKKRKVLWEKNYWCGSSGIYLAGGAQPIWQEHKAYSTGLAKPI